MGLRRPSTLTTPGGTTLTPLVGLPRPTKRFCPVPTLATWRPLDTSSHLASPAPAASFRWLTVSNCYNTFTTSSWSRNSMVLCWRSDTMSCWRSLRFLSLKTPATLACTLGTLSSTPILGPATAPQAKTTGLQRVWACAVTATTTPRVSDSPRLPTAIR